MSKRQRRGYKRKGARRGIYGGSEKNKEGIDREERQGESVIIALAGPDVNSQEPQATRASTAERKDRQKKKRQS